MTCAPSFHTSAALAAACLALAGTPLSAQPPVPTPPATPVTVLAPYRAPLITLVQPAMPPDGSSALGAVPRDRPAIVLRFAAGEPDDPVDVRSLLVVVDGADRTTLFRTTATEAWGALASEAQLARGELPAGSHHVVARICSTRGVCTSAEAQVLVTPALVRAAVDHDAPATRGLTRVLGAVMSATRKLLLP